VEHPEALVAFSSMARAPLLRVVFGPATRTEVLSAGEVAMRCQASQPVRLLRVAIDLASVRRHADAAATGDHPSWLSAAKAPHHATDKWPLDGRLGSFHR
jgi:hypothetical protein